MKDWLCCAKPIFFLFLLGLVSCKQTQQAKLNDYVTRMARVTQQSIPPSEFSPYPTLTAAHMALPLEPLRLGLLDFLRLSRCKIALVVAKKNGTLNQFSQPSQKMHLDKALLMHGTACVDLLEASQPDLAVELNALLETKREQRMRIWWNAWFSSQEWQAFVRPSHEPLGDGLSDLSALRFALSQGLRWRDRHYDYNDSDMEQALNQLRLDGSLGRWLYAQRQLITTFTQVAQMLEDKHRSAPFCRYNRQDPKANILENVFVKYYVKNVQPYLARTVKIGDSLTQEIAQLVALGEPPRAFVDWWRAVHDERKALRVANIRHIKAWQMVLSRCGRMPSKAYTSE